jgi:hypothetical protein
LLTIRREDPWTFIPALPSGAFWLFHVKKPLMTGKGGEINHSGAGRGMKKIKVLNQSLICI